MARPSRRWRNPPGFGASARLADLGDVVSFVQHLVRLMSRTGDLPSGETKQATNKQGTEQTNKQRNTETTTARPTCTFIAGVINIYFESNISNYTNANVCWFQYVSITNILVKLRFVELQRLRQAHVHEIGEGSDSRHLARKMGESPTGWVYFKPQMDGLLWMFHEINHPISSNIPKSSREIYSWMILLISQ